MTGLAIYEIAGISILYQATTSFWELLMRIYFRSHDFRSLVDVRPAAARFTVMIGPNGSGKTALLEVIRLLHAGSTAASRIF